MKKMTQKLCTLFVAVMLMLTGFATDVQAVGAGEKATVTLSGLEEGAKVNLYRIVTAVYNGNKLQAYELDDRFVDPREEVVLSTTLTKLAGDLDVNYDTMIDAEFEGTAVPTEFAGKPLYNMNEPSQQQIFTATPIVGLDAAYLSGTVGTGLDYIQFEVEAGQYIAIIEHPAGSENRYNPVVLSAGYEGVPAYTADGTGLSGDPQFYKKLDGTFTKTAPNAETKHLYASDAWNDTTNTAANPKYYETETTANTLIAKDLNLENATYDWTMVGTTAIAKKTEKPDVEKDIDNPKQDELIAIVAVDANGNVLRDGDKLLYVKSPFTKENYNDILNAAEGEFEIVGGVMTPQAGGSFANKAAALAAMRTTHLTEATTETRAVLVAGIGDVVHYSVTPTIPIFPQNAINQTLVVTDKMSEGLTYVQGSLNVDMTPFTVVKLYDSTTKEYDFYIKSVEVFNNEKSYLPQGTPTKTNQFYYRDGTGAFKPITATDKPAVGTEMYQLLARAKDTATTEKDFQVNINYQALPGVGDAKQNPVLKYDGIINENAVQGVEGNDNTAKFFYGKTTSTTPTHDIDDFDTPSDVDVEEKQDKVTVYTYEIRFRKTNDKDEYLEKADGEYYKVTGSLDPSTGADEEEKAKITKVATWVYENGVRMAKKDDGDGEWFVTVAKYEALTDADIKAAIATDKKYAKNPEFEVLKGAKFGLYRDPDCTDLVVIIETNDEGIGTSTDVAAGKYYLKEIAAPTGYSLSTEVTEVEAVWTTATVTTTDTVTKKVYTANITEAEDYNASATPQAQQVGWLVGDSTNGTYANMTAYPTATWNYDETNKVMINKNTQEEIPNVFRAYLKETVVTQSSSSEVIYNNGGGVTYLIRINNTKDNLLPSTGGIGTYMFTAAGVAILALAAFMLIFRKKEVQQ